MSAKIVKAKLDTTTINDVVVKPIPKEKIDPDMIQGYDALPRLYANVGIFGRKETGKTNVAHTLLLHRLGVDTETVMFFTSSAYTDDNYGYMMRELDSLAIPYEVEVGLEESKKGGGKLKDKITKIRSKPVMELPPIPAETKNGTLGYGVLKIKPFATPELPAEDSESEDDSDSEEEEIPKISPKLIVICDDLSKSGRATAVQSLVVTNRHAKADVYIATHVITDVLPAVRKNLNFLCLFEGITEDDFIQLLTEASVKILPSKLYPLYRDITEGTHRFLYINCSISDVPSKKLQKKFNTNQLRIGFDQLIDPANYAT